MGIIFLSASILTGALGQVLFKLGVNRIDSNGMQLYFDLLKNIWVYAGFLCYGISFLLWMMVLKVYDVSFARPLTSVGYIVTYALAVCFLGERLTLRRIVATIIITAGVLLMR